MKNLVGDKIPSIKEIDASVASVVAAGQKMAPYTIALSVEDRKRLVRFRRGGERIVALIATLAQRYGLVLPVSVEAMQADLELAERLIPLAHALAAVSRVVNDTIIEARSECWWAATAYYTALSRMRAGDPALEAELRAAVDFFARGPRAPKAVSA